MFSEGVFQFWCISYHVVLQFMCWSVCSFQAFLKALSIHPCLAHRRCFLWTCSWSGEVQEIHSGGCRGGWERATVGSQGGLHGEGVLWDELWRCDEITANPDGEVIPWEQGMRLPDQSLSLERWAGTGGSGRWWVICNLICMMVMVSEEGNLGRECSMD